VSHLHLACGLLKDRLVRRGLAPTADSPGVLLAADGVRAAVPEPLAAATVRAAVRVSMGGASQAGAASASAVTLLNEVLLAAVVFKLTENLFAQQNREEPPGRYDLFKPRFSKRQGIAGTLKSWPSLPGRTSRSCCVLPLTLTQADEATITFVESIFGTNAICSTASWRRLFCTPSARILAVGGLPESPIIPIVRPTRYNYMMGNRIDQVLSISMLCNDCRTDTL
jgi:hypothetical protein